MKPDKVIMFDPSALEDICKLLGVPYDKDIVGFTKDGVIKADPKVSKQKTTPLDTPLWFGKHRGRTIRELIEEGEASYIEWAIGENIFELNEEDTEYLEYHLDDEERDRNFGYPDDDWGDR